MSKVEIQDQSSVTNTTLQTTVTYNFKEKVTGKVLGVMHIKSEIASNASGWITTKSLDEILEGGIAKGLAFVFPDQRAPQLSYGTGGDCWALHDSPYGSSDGSKLDIGCANGHIYGFVEENRLMVLTFEPEGVGGLSHGDSAITMANDPIENGTGLFQKGEGDEHGDKYIYFGVWELA